MNHKEEYKVSYLSGYIKSVKSITMKEKEIQGLRDCVDVLPSPQPWEGKNETRQEEAGFAYCGEGRRTGRGEKKTGTAPVSHPANDRNGPCRRVPCHPNPPIPGGGMLAGDRGRTTCVGKNSDAMA